MMWCIVFRKPINIFLLLDFGEEMSDGHPRELNCTVKFDMGRKINAPPMELKACHRGQIPLPSAIPLRLHV